MYFGLGESFGLDDRPRRPRYPLERGGGKGTDLPSDAGTDSREESVFLGDIGTDKPKQIRRVTRGVFIDFLAT